jgi:hypothetical protein
MSKQKLQKLQSSLNEEEAGLLFHLLLKSLETANHQKVEYSDEPLQYMNTESLMVNLNIDLPINKSFVDKFKEAIK